VWNSATCKPEAVFEFDGFYRSSGVVFPSGRLVCVCDKMSLIFVQVPEMEEVSRFQGQEAHNEHVSGGCHGQADHVKI
jgi:hypothetical protein